VITGIRQQAVGNSKKLKLVVYALCAMQFALCPSARAQQPKKVSRIGYLSLGSQIETREAAFQKGLRELGYIEGHNIQIDWRLADGNPDRLTGLASELTRLRPDCIVASGTASTSAAERLTNSLPIVMINVGDAIERGFVISLARPGRNITGFTSLSPDLSDKRLELLKEAFPKISKIAILWDPSRLGTDAHIQETERAARGLGLHIQSIEVRRGEDIDAAFQGAQKTDVDAIMVLGAGFSRYQARIINLPVKYRLPVIYSDPGYVSAGGLMSYSADLVEPFRRAATYVDKILKGAKPADLPVEQPTKFELLINLKAAKQIGLTIPPTVLARAGRVIR
jgi:putative ABC transport system substrate-binding protein